jgi:hypothetical protein
MQLVGEMPQPKGHLSNRQKCRANADTSTEDSLLNKKAMASVEMVICRKLEKAGQNANASTEDALLSKKSHGICHNGHLRKTGNAGQNSDTSTEEALLSKKSHGICRHGDDRNGQTMAKCHDNVTGHQLRWRAAGPVAGEFTR